jgi:hypothetical protein
MCGYLWILYLVFHQWASICFVAWNIAEILLKYYLGMVFWDDTRLYGTCSKEFIVYQRPELDLLVRF